MSGTYKEVKAILDAWDARGDIRTSLYYRLHSILLTLPRTLGDTSKARAVIEADKKRQKLARRKKP